MTDMKIVPLNNYVLCEKYTTLSVDLKGLVSPVKQEEMDLYKVLDINSEKPTFFNIGDVVMCNSTGTTFDDNTRLFNVENIACVVEV